VAAESASMPQAERTCHRTPPLRTQPIKDGQRRFLCARRQISRWTDARRTPLLAPARCDQLAGLLHQQFMRAEKRFRKADAARVGVEEIQVGLEELLRARTKRVFQPRWRKHFGSHR